MRITPQWAGLIGLTLVGVVGFFLQRQVTEELQVEVALKREEGRELARLRSENQRQRAAQIAPVELEGLRADHAAVGRLRGETETLQRRIDDISRAAAAKITADGMVPASAWRNVGRATPLAAYETALWAAAGGEMEILEKSLSLDRVGRVRLENLYAQLPDSIRTQYGSPERLLAMLVVKDAPLGGMKLLAQTERGPDDVDLRVRVQSAEGEVRTTGLTLHRYTDGWRLMVPDGVIKGFAGSMASQPTGR